MFKYVTKEKYQRIQCLVLCAGRYIAMDNQIIQKGFDMTAIKLGNGDRTIFGKKAQDPLLITLFGAISVVPATNFNEKAIHFLAVSVGHLSQKTMSWFHIAWRTITIGNHLTGKRGMFC